MCPTFERNPSNDVTAPILSLRSYLRHVLLLHFSSFEFVFIFRRVTRLARCVCPARFSSFSLLFFFFFSRQAGVEWRYSGSGSRGLGKWRAIMRYTPSTCALVVLTSREVVCFLCRDRRNCFGVTWTRFFFFFLFNVSRRRKARGRWKDMALLVISLRAFSISQPAYPSPPFRNITPPLSLCYSQSGPH